MVGMEHFTASMKMKQNTAMNKYKIRKLEEKIMVANIETMFYVRETPWHQIQVTGRIQSREYEKTEESEKVKKRAYEVSVFRLNLVE